MPGSRTTNKALSHWRALRTTNMYKIVVKAGYRQRTKLKRMGFTWSEGQQHWEKLSEGYPTPATRRKLAWLNYEIEDVDQYRSTNYRQTYLSAKKYVKIRNGQKYYRCVYCGKLLKSKDMQVDHLYPVKKATTDPYIRKKMKKSGIKNVNQLENLVSACKRCNEKKGADTGIWIVRGILGKSEPLWVVRRALCISLIALALTYLIPLI